MSPEQFCQQIFFNFDSNREKEREKAREKALAHFGCPYVNDVIEIVDL